MVFGGQNCGRIHGGMVSQMVETTVVMGWLGVVSGGDVVVVGVWVGVSM